MLRKILGLIVVVVFWGRMIFFLIIFKFFFGVLKVVVNVIFLGGFVVIVCLFLFDFMIFVWSLDSGVSVRVRWGWLVVGFCWRFIIGVVMEVLFE